MPKVKFNNDRTTSSIGRNGVIITTGVDIFPSTERVELSPITSKDTVGNCSISIPISDVFEVVDTMKEAVREWAKKQVVLTVNLSNGWFYMAFYEETYYFDGSNIYRLKESHKKGFDESVPVKIGQYLNDREERIVLEFIYQKSKNNVGVR